MRIFGRYRPEISIEHQEAEVVEMWERENECNQHSVLHFLLLYLTAATVRWNKVA